jgi:hypothetical protein
MSRSIIHDPELCGLDIDTRPVCCACLADLFDERARHVSAERRRRRRDAIRRALPPIARAWVRALIRRELRHKLEEGA